MWRYRYQEMIPISKDKYGQGERIARIIHLLATEGSKSYPELRERFPKISEATLERDIKLLKKTKVVVDRKEARVVAGVISRKVFMFFKDDKDIVGKTKKAMENLKQDFNQVTLEQIASYSGLPPEKIVDTAYALAPKLNLLIGKEAKATPPPPLIVGAHEKKKPTLQRKQKQRTES